MQPGRRSFLAAVPAVLLAAPAFARMNETALWKALREGNHVLLMRHASTEPGLGDPAGYKLGDCATQRNLSEAGREESRRIAERLKAEKIPVARVYTSPWCRCRDTAKLAFGRAEDWDPLSSFFDMPEREVALTESVKKRITSYAIRKPGGNVAMVTHNVNIAAITRLSVEPAELVIVKPDGCCSLKVLGRLKV